MRASSENRTHDLFLTKEVLSPLSYPEAWRIVDSNH